MSAIPDCLIHDPASYVEPLDLAAVFPASRPLEVELGSGDGSWLVQYAAAHPERNFLGVERLLGRLTKIDKKGRRLGLGNLRALRIEASYFLQYLLPAGCAQALHIYFADPWPKLRHRKNRLINQRFPQLAARIFAPGGVVFLRTDDTDYFQQMQEVFGAASQFGPAEAPAELTEVLTDFEREFNARGIPTLRAAYRLKA